MSVRSVQKLIKQAMKTHRECESPTLSAGELNRILTEAERGPLTQGEGELLGDFYGDGRVQPDRRGIATMACPELSGDAYYMSSRVEKKFNDFFVEHNLPYGRPQATTLAVGEEMIG